jgi:hypothetical protein
MKPETIKAFEGFAFIQGQGVPIGQGQDQDRPAGLVLMHPAFDPGNAHEELHFRSQKL